MSRQLINSLGRKSLCPRARVGKRPSKSEQHPKITASEQQKTSVFTKNLNTLMKEKSVPESGKLLFSSLNVKFRDRGSSMPCERFAKS